MIIPTNASNLGNTKVYTESTVRELIQQERSLIADELTKCMNEIAYGNTAKGLDGIVKMIKTLRGEK
jgi:hypothetical protein